MSNEIDKFIKIKILELAKLEMIPGPGGPYVDYKKVLEILTKK